MWFVSWSPIGERFPVLQLAFLVCSETRSGVTHHGLKLSSVAESDTKFLSFPLLPTECWMTGATIPAFSYADDRSQGSGHFRQTDYKQLQSLALTPFIS